jgi:hypothetical protein
MSENIFSVFRIISWSLTFYYVIYLGKYIEKLQILSFKTERYCGVAILITQKILWGCSIEIASYMYKNKLHYLTLNKHKAVMRTAGLEMWFLNATTSCSGHPELYTMCVETFTLPYVVQWECFPIKLYNKIPCLVGCLEFWIPLFLDSTDIKMYCYKLYQSPASHNI